MATKKAASPAKKQAATTEVKSVPAKAAAKKTAAKKTVAATAETPAPKAATSAKKTVESAKKASATHDEIAKLAHKYWQERGHHHGAHNDDWLRAEKELNS